MVFIYIFEHVSLRIFVKVKMSYYRMYITRKICLPINFIRILELYSKTYVCLKLFNRRNFVKQKEPIATILITYKKRFIEVSYLILGKQHLLVIVIIAQFEGKKETFSTFSVMDLSISRKI